MRRNVRKSLAACAVLIALGALSVATATAAAAGGDIPGVHGCDEASPNYPQCLLGTAVPDDPGDPGDPVDPGATGAQVGGATASDDGGGESGSLPFTGADLVLFTVFAAVAIGAGGFVLLSRRRRPAEVHADLE
jgi:hypothetical protein